LRREVPGQRAYAVGSFAQQHALQLASDPAPSGPEGTSSKARGRKREYLVRSFRLDREDNAKELSKLACPTQHQPFASSWNRTWRSGVSRDGDSRRAGAIRRLSETPLKAAQARRRRSGILRTHAASGQSYLKTCSNVESFLRWRRGVCFKEISEAPNLRLCRSTLAIVVVDPHRS
jgi:hypothetical protein